MSDTRNNLSDKAPDLPAPRASQAGKILKGVVVKRAMRDTATVQVERYVKHPKYKKYQRQSKKFLAHDPGNTTEVGEEVTIRETRPISKRKRFVIVKKEA